MSSTKRVGPRMRQATEYVAAHPGTNKKEVAKAVSPILATSLMHGYMSVNRAIVAGLIHAHRTPRGTYRLTVNS